MEGFVTYVPLAVLLIGFTFAVYIDPYIIRKNKIVLYSIIIVDTIMVVQEYFDYTLRNMDSPHPLRPYVIFLGYALRPILAFLFCYIIYPEGKHRISKILVVINVIINFVSVYTGIAFAVSETNDFVRGPLGYTCHIVSGVIMLYTLFVAVRKYKDEPLMNTVFLVFNIAAIITSAVVDAFHYGAPVSVLTRCVVCSCVLMYIWLHFQFVKTHEKVIAEQQQVKLMVSQIRPHFLYNTLSTIQALCLTDPQRASETTEKFGTYVRHNLNVINQPSLIPIEKEIEHTQLYVDIEKIRFPNITVNYIIEDSDFSLPALSVQPMVENAIRHGVRGMKNGTVTVSTKKLGNYHQITIEDNGKGFDVEAAFNADEKHIGIRNVRSRIKTMCHGELTAKSTIGKGTIITIMIPDKEQK